MATSWPGAAVTYAPATSVDIAQNQKYNVQALAGVKRPYGHVDSFHHQRPFHQSLSFRQPPLANSGVDQQKPPAPPPPRLQASCILPAEGSGHSRPTGYVPPNPLPPIISSTPGPSQNPLLTLRHSRYDLPTKLLDNLESLGVRSIYPWQSSCLLGRGLLSGEQNLVYTAPTGGGKSLVADVLLLKKIIENPQKKSILVLPYVALVQEKLKLLRALTDGVSKQVELSDEPPNPTWRRPSPVIRVAGFFGGSRPTVQWADCDVAVCTIEKANSLLNSAIEEGKHGEIAVVVLDELHMINDEHRGYLMELLATKLMSLDCGIQIVGMSATLPNPQLLATWLKSKFYIAKYRPIPIEEHLVYENEIYPTASAKEFFRTASQLTAEDSISTPRPQACRTITKSDHKDLGNPMINAVVALSVETAVSGHGALVFCSSRMGVERTAVLISDAMPLDCCDHDAHAKRQDLIASLRALPGGFEASFSKTILVILNGARMGRDLVGPAMLRQMRGRAGRKGKDELGETFLCCHKPDLEAVAELLEAELPPVTSCLTPEKQGIKRALLEIVAIRMASSRSAVDQYVQSSLLWHTMDRQIVFEMVEDSLRDLLANELIQTTAFENCLEPTKLGMAVVASGLSPEDGVFVHSELRRALESFVMDGDMHIFYLFTPVQTAGLGEISWLTFRNQVDSLDESGLRALQLVGVNPAFVNRLVNSGAELKENTPDELRLARIYRRAYSAFQLRDLCNEMPVHEVSLKYSVPRGQIQNLAQTCHGFAAGMIKFCERMGWGMLSAVLEHMLDRLRAGARADLLDMAQVAFVKSRMARIFWENGLKTVRALSEADPQTLVPVMLQAQTRKMKLQGEAAERVKAKLLAKAEIIVSSASRLWEKQQIVEWEEE
ncbi:DNA polymerase theta subunit [Exophiala viscosa]|uniref:DNA polymerase theta subunit n=1 Tax=Exophiala viscosa TaxID=2486360 RepID=A0AAN6DSA1_9EURO|nr:DNA polymerase theta subunit [Exophiala viscosa]